MTEDRLSASSTQTTRRQPHGQPITTAEEQHSTHYHTIVEKLTQFGKRLVRGRMI